MIRHALTLAAATLAVGALAGSSTASEPQLSALVRGGSPGAILQHHKL